VPGEISWFAAGCEGATMSRNEAPDPRWIAACGLDCGSCEIRRLPFDEKAAQKTIGWYRQMGWLKEDEGVADALERKMYCSACKGDRSAHWSVNEDGTCTCWILACCVDQKGLEFCSNCNEFPCERLVDWSKTDHSYTAALHRLEGM
jgi:hypothetical protein